MNQQQNSTNRSQSCLTQWLYRRLTTLAMLSVALSAAGCIAAAAPAVEEVGSVAPAATGFFSTQSADQLNRVNEAYLKAQTIQIRSQLAQTRRQQELADSKRAATVGILRDLASWRHDPLINDMAQWVQAGGDPDYAMKFAMNRVGADASRQAAAE